jgi:3-(3-hydroxy-phenyl)propionate hydroxylase
MVFDVAIMGYGPAGATLANLLGQAGLSVVVFEKDAEIYPLPRAIHFDGEVMRVFQAIGLRAEMEAISRPGMKGMHFVNAANDTLLIRGGTAALGPHGCANNHYFHQPELEHVLREGVTRFANVSVRLQHLVTDVQEHADHIDLHVTDLRNQQPHSVQARYVVGCDGARSLARKLLNCTTRDLGLHQPWLVFDVLLKPGAPELPDHTVQLCDPQRPMTYCNVTGNRRRWEIMLMPGDDTAELVKPENLWPLVSRWIQPEHADIERAVIYTFHSIIAQGWRQGRLMIAGDAAHQTPPFLGQGMCAAIRDVSNLAWKLQAVVRGTASDTLLDSYESERAPHVAEFIELAVRLGDIIQTTDPEQARLRDAKFRNGGEPEIFQFPAPRLGAGILSNGPAPVGQPFPQPQLANACWLDELVGNHFAVIAHADVLAKVTEATRQAWSTWQASVLDASDPTLALWLNTHRAAAVVLRPDRYVLGLAHTSAELDALTRDWLPTQAVAENAA